MSTKVLFPRFQYEVNTELRTSNEHDFAWRVPARAWMDAIEWRQVQKPSAVQRNHFSNLKGEWWGTFHAGHEVTSFDRVFQSPFESESSGLYRTATTHHRYIMGDQKTSGQRYATEIVLKQCADGAEKERAALLSLGRDGYSTQRFMIAPSGTWIEPEFDGVDDRRDFYLLLITELAIAAYGSQKVAA